MVSEPVGAKALLDSLDWHDATRDLSVMVVAPALARDAETFHVGDAQEAVARAEKVCETTVSALEQRGIAANGHVGAADPATAASDALRVFNAEQVLQFEHAPARRRFREPAPVAEAARRVRCADEAD